jgi:hypothetical protein
MKPSEIANKLTNLAADKRALIADSLLHKASFPPRSCISVRKGGFI